MLAGRLGHRTLGRDGTPLGGTGTSHSVEPDRKMGRVHARFFFDCLPRVRFLPTVSDADIYAFHFLPALSLLIGLAIVDRRSGEHQIGVIPPLVKHCTLSATEHLTENRLRPF